MSHIEYNSRAKGPRAPVMSSSYDHNEKHFRFQRSHEGEIEVSNAVSGWGHDLIVLGGIAVCIAILWAFAWVLSGIFA